MSKTIKYNNEKKSQQLGAWNEFDEVPAVKNESIDSIYTPESVLMSELTNDKRLLVKKQWVEKYTPESIQAYLDTQDSRCFRRKENHNKSRYEFLKAKLGDKFDHETWRKAHSRKEVK